MTKTGLIKGTIDNHVNLDVSANGDVHLDPGSTARNFPSLEAYSYTADAKGDITSTKIVDRPEASSNDENGDLTHPEQPIQ
jgi:hypothetical protein